MKISNISRVSVSKSVGHTFRCYEPATKISNISGISVSNADRVLFGGVL